MTRYDNLDVLERPAQRVPVPESWLENRHRAGTEEQFVLSRARLSRSPGPASFRRVDQPVVLQEAHHDPRLGFSALLERKAHFLVERFNSQRLSPAMAGRRVLAGALVLYGV